MRIVAGEAKGRRLASPPPSVTRSATERIRESLFAQVEREIADARVLDLFAGAGTLGLEALSRGAASATFVERHRSALAALRANVAATRMSDRARVVAADVEAFLERLGDGRYEIVFCDPPFAAVELHSRVLAHPRLRRALAPGALVVSRSLRKHRPAVPEGANVERERRIGEEVLLLLRYDAAAEA